MPDWIIAVILGIVEGITEFIPVSSTGHLLIAEHWLHSHQTDLFNIVIQCGAVIAVIPLFHKRFHQFLFQWREKATQDYLLKIAVAFVITGAVGFVLDKKGLKLKDDLQPIAIAVLVGGVAFLLVEFWLRGKKMRDEITWPVVIAVALGQFLAAVFPGTSRSGATIVFALLLGSEPPARDGIFLPRRHPHHARRRRIENLQSPHHPLPDAPHENWSMVLLSTGSGGHRLLHRREMAAAFRANPHVQRLRLVPRRARSFNLRPVAPLITRRPLTNSRFTHHSLPRRRNNNRLARFQRLRLQSRIRG